MNSHNFLVLAALGLVGQASANAPLPGSCPKITKQWDEQAKGKLELGKIQGIWKNIYDNEDHAEGF